MHEAQQHDENCFITLTYATENLPPGDSLQHRDFQLFMKRLRKAKGEVRFYMCGEYGDLKQRPHYHACLFGVNFRQDRAPAGKSGSGALFFDSKELRDLWKLGIVSVQDLTKETAGYCARYIMKKALGKGSENAYDRIDADGAITKRAPEYACMSLKPGIGSTWFAKYQSDVFPCDYVIQGGVKRRPPRYYDKLLERSKDVRKDQIDFARQERAKLSGPDNTDERRAVREKVHTARLRNFKRD